MGKTSDLTVVQKTVIDTLHKEGKPQKVAGCSQSDGKLTGSVVGKWARATGMTAALRGLLSKADS